MSGQAEWLLKLLFPTQLGLLDLCIHETFFLAEAPDSQQHLLSRQCTPESWSGVHLSLPGTKTKRKHFGKSSVNAICVSKSVKYRLLLDNTKFTACERRLSFINKP